MDGHIQNISLLELAIRQHHLIIPRHPPIIHHPNLLAQQLSPAVRRQVERAETEFGVAAAGVLVHLLDQARQLLQRSIPPSHMSVLRYLYTLVPSVNDELVISWHLVIQKLVQTAHT